MSSYTMRLSEIVDDYCYGEYFTNDRDKIEIARKKMFDFDYPVFDVAYKKVFETNFIRRFYTREIGFETDGLFKFQLETWLLINMPYFNALMESELLKYDPLVNSSVDITHTKKNDKIQNDIREGNQNIVGNEVSNVTQKETKNETGKSDSIGSQDTLSSGTSGTSETFSSDSSSDSTGTKTTNTDETSKVTTDDFNRKLTSDTPDSRLTITTNDGQGVIEYASKIDEVNSNNEKDTDSHTDSTVTSKETTDSTSSGNSDSDTITKGTTNVDSKDSSTVETDAVKNNTGNSEIDSTNEISKNDTLSSNVNNIEDFIEHRVGKTGIQSYAELVMKYRESLIRVEKTIFNEMQELFMLVY